MQQQARSKKRRNRHRAIIGHDQPPCALCGGPIDYTAPQYHPQAFTVDHIVPIAAGGADTLDNCQAAHWSCNQRKGDRLPPGHTNPATFRDSNAVTEHARGLPAHLLPAGVSFITGRSW